MDCEKCPIAEECGLSGEEKKMCPLVALIREWRMRTLKKIMKPTAPSETLKVQDEIYKRICFIHEVRGSHKTVSELLREFSRREILKSDRGNSDLLHVWLLGRRPVYTIHNMDS